MFAQRCISRTVSEVDPLYKRKFAELRDLFASEGVTLDDFDYQKGHEKLVSINLGIDESFIKYTMTIELATRKCCTLIEMYCDGEDLEFERRSILSRVGILFDEEKRRLESVFGTKTNVVMRGLSVLQKHYWELDFSS